MPARPPSPNPAHVPGATPWGVAKPDPRDPDADKPPPPPPMTCGKCGKAGCTGGCDDQGD